MPLIHDNAVVLRCLDFSETSQIAVLFTRLHGKVRVIAKGIKRSTATRFASAIDLLELGGVVWAARSDRQDNLGNLTEWKQQAGFSGLRERLPALYAGLYVADVTAELTADEDPHPQVFDALVGCLEALSATNADVLSPLCAFQRALLIDIGLMPHLDNCQSCRRPTDVICRQALYFSSHEGGLLCRDCEGAYAEKRRVSWELVRELASGTIQDAHLADAFEALNHHLAQVMGKLPKLAAYLLPAKPPRTPAPS